MDEVDRVRDVERSERLHNADLAPAKQRDWNAYSLFALWMSDVHSIGGYTFAAGLFVLGLVGWQVLIALLVGIVLVNIGVNLIGYASQRTGVPYPVIARMSFGVFGANIPALTRAIIAILWYGIQTYLASVAIVVLLLAIDPALEPYSKGGFLGLSPLGWLAFLVLWALQLLVMRHGMETVRKYQHWAGPAIWVVMLALAVWMIVAAGGDITLNLSRHPVSGWDAVVKFLAAVSLTIAYFSTLMLNFGDFARFAPTRRAVTVGNFWGLPVNFTAFSVVTVIVTAGSISVFGEAVSDPVELVAKIPNTAVLVLGAVTFVVATIGVNIVANFVSPAYDLANLAPKYLTFRRGGLISAVVAVLVLPWKLYSSPVVVNYFLGGLAAFLGPLFAIIAVDFYLLRKRMVNVDHLYQTSGEYYYRKGVNPRAVAAFVPAAVIAGAVALVPALSAVAPFSWFVGAFLGGAIYYVIMKDVRRYSYDDLS